MKNAPRSTVLGMMISYEYESMFKAIPLGNSHRSDYFIFDMTKREITTR